MNIVKSTFRFILIFLTPIILTGQNLFIIQKCHKPSKTIVLKANSRYKIKTKDAVYAPVNLIAITDTSLRVTRAVENSDPTTTQYAILHALDSIYERVWRTDTIDIKFRELIYIERFAFENTKWVEPFTLILGGLGLAGSSVSAAAIPYGPEYAIIAAVVILSTAAICVTVVFISSRKVKYHMQDDWRFIGTRATTR